MQTQPHTAESIGTDQRTTDLMQRIEAIDLTMVKQKLMDTDEGEGWTHETANLMEVRYKRFLFLTVVHQGTPIVPTKDIDKMWHYHILDTRAYAKDRETAFGRFLHHFPYFGLRGEADRARLLSSFENTCAVYEHTYGEPYVLHSRATHGDSSSCGTGACAKCGEAYCSSIEN